MNEFNNLPLDMIQLQEEEMALLKGGVNDNDVTNNGCDCNCGGSKCSDPDIGCMEPLTPA